MLSILIPTYNYDLATLIGSLEAQTSTANRPVEVIICDDASTDKKLALANQQLAQQANFEYLANTQNLGRTATRDKLAKKAKYDWLLFLDADVLPVTKNFLDRYLAKLNGDFDVICGGIAYSKERPAAAEQRLRWKYGHKKEMKSVAERNKNPFTVVSANLVLRKSVFLKCNPRQSKQYGLDNVFSVCLKNRYARVQHIDNPAYHLGLESNEAFIKKSLASIDTTLQSESEGEMDSTSRPIQQAYLRLKRWGLLPVFKLVTRIFGNTLAKNLNSKNPSIFLFDLYRLQYYIKKKQ